MDSTTPVNKWPYDMLRSPRQRYEGDPIFKSLVDAMVAYIEQAEFTPSELRQAATYASIRHAMRSSEPCVIPRRMVEHLRTLEEWLDSEITQRSDE